MGMQTATKESTAGAQTQYGQQGLDALQQYLQEVQGMQQQSLTPTGQDRALVGQVQEASGAVARQQMEQNMQQILRQTEDTAIGRGIEGSSMEAINNALIGQNFQQQLAQMAMQQQGQSAQQLMNLPFQRSQAANQQNLARFQMLTGAAAPMVNYDAMMRHLNQTTTEETPSQAMQNLPAQFQIAKQVGGMFVGGGGGEGA